MRNIMDPAIREFLIADVGRLMRKWFVQRSASQGHPLVQWTMVARLWDNEGLKQAELADLMELEPITLSRHVDRLEKDGIVERRPDANDRRVWRLYLTAKAKPMMEEISKARGEVIERLFEGISLEDQVCFQRVLVALQKNLQLRVS